MIMDNNLDQFQKNVVLPELKDSIETAYSFFHQKRNVYIHSSLQWQRDDIEWAVASYVEGMNPILLSIISCGRPDFLLDHLHFNDDLASAVDRLEALLL